MRFIIGFLAGLATAWAALAIWQHTSLPEGEWHTDVPDIHDEYCRAYEGRPCVCDLYDAPRTQP